MWGDKQDGGDRFENLREKSNSPTVKIFPGGVAGMGGVCENGKVARVVVMLMSVMLMWVLHANWFWGPVL